MTDEALFELLPEYALGALPPEDAQAVEALLERSAEARAELRALRAALVAVAEALPQHAPSGAVWEKLEATFAAEVGAEAGALSTLRDRPPPPRSPLYAWLAAACFALFGMGAGLWGLENFRAAQGAQQAQQLVAAYLSTPDVQRVALYDAQAALGSVLLAGERALFVLADAPGPQRAYQAWGHSATDWEPGGSERLTSLAVSDGPVFEVVTASFAALYLSVEPPGGSDQPTRPLARVSLVAPVSERPITLLQPAPGAAQSGTVIVRGLVSSAVRDLAYRLNGSEPRPVSLAGSAFTFTLTGLPPGESVLVLTATLRDGGEAEERVTLEVP
jgi:hypothetical protein